MRTIQCAICGKDYTAANPGRTCSMKCQRVLHYKLMAARRGKVPIRYVCEVCGQEFSSFRRGCKACSGECRRKRSHLIGQKNQMAYWSKLANGEELKNNPYLKLRFEILKRDNFKCTYCGNGAIQGVRLHVDHIHPRAEGGTDAPDNLTTACSSCNLGKSDVLLTQRILVKSAKPIENKG